jgi:hemoglobin
MSIYDTIGGDRSVSETVEKFYAKLRSDPDLAEFFERTDVGELETRQRMFLTAALGGPDAYEGRDMRAAHAHLKITEVAFDLFLGHLAESLAEIGTTPARIAEVMGALEPLRLEIVSARAEGADEFGFSDLIGGSG